MPTVSRIRLHYNNVYIVDGGGVRVLIDTGPDYAGAWESIQSELEDRQPDIVVATHGHLDHAGLGSRWLRLGVPVVLHHSDHHLCRTAQLEDERDFSAMVAYIRACGAPEDVEDEAIHGLRERRDWAIAAATAVEHPPAGGNRRWPTGLRFERFVPRAAASVVATLAAAGLEIHHMPGHTPGNLIVECPDEGFLFSGDQLLPDITPTPAIQFVANGAGQRVRFRSLPEFVASMERIDADDLGRCLPGHGEPFTDVHKTIWTNLKTINDRTDRLLSELTRLGSASVFELCAATYPRAVRRRFWQIVATIQGNLDLAEARGLATLNEGRYQRAD